MARTTRHVRWGLAAALVGLGLLAPSAFGSAPVEQVPGASAIDDDTEAANLAAIGADGGGHARSAARIVAKSAHEVVVRGRTRQARPIVKIRGYQEKRNRWVTLAKVRAKKHTYQARVVTDGVATTTLRVKAAKEPRQVVALSDACGVRPTKADGTLWACTFSDEFEGTTLDRTKWLPQTTGFTTGDDTNFACYKDDPRNVAVSGGALRLSLTQGAAEPCPGLRGKVTGFSSGSVSTYRLFSQKYGRFEARTRNTAASVSGLHEAFWLWPDDRYVDVTKWPASGEIDVVETYSQYPTLAIPFLHTSWDAFGPLPGINTAWTCAAQRGVFNTYAVEWTPAKIEIFVNGRLCLRANGRDQAFQAPYIVALTQGIGAAPNRFTDRTPIPATYEVDYIRVWS